ncbi:response regulator [Methanoregula sp.]|uniref:response regulator n=1 Tax=Methanoregula sp. TaxID=2052170 RepID=UPI00236D1A27|nr:response regulator [Methanoregula sp.]MDD1687087.1 response regulator [Methanoregula sp.]
MHSVLVVDDEEELLDVMRLFLERAGSMTVRTAASSKEALDILEDQSFDALVLDYYMPEITGIELLKILRAKGDTTPVIVFTGIGRENAAIEALNNGADFFLKKGDGPVVELRELVDMINRAVDRRFLGKSMGMSQKVIADTISFFPEAAFAIDHEGKVLAWNEGMAEITGTGPGDLIGKGNLCYSVPILGQKGPVLGDLIFEPDETIVKNGYTIITRDKDTVLAWTFTRGNNGNKKAFWMKAKHLHDTKGAFIAVITMIRDITVEKSREIRELATSVPDLGSLPDTPGPAQGGMLGRIFGKAKSIHRDALYLSFREGKYDEAIPLFTRAIETDPAFAFAWHDRGVCFRELGRDEEALRDFNQAAKLLPDDEEVLFSRADLLNTMALQRGEAKIFNAAIRALNRTLEVNPHHARAWNSLGICMKAMGQSETAQQYFDRSNELIKMGWERYKKRNLEGMV